MGPTTPPPETSTADRARLQDFVGDILLKTDNYAGFLYQQPYGEPGSDPTRIQFLKSHKL